MRKPGVTEHTGLRTSSLSRRVLLSSMAVLILVLAGAGVLTDVLLGAQLRSDAATRLESRIAQAQAALADGAQSREVVAAAQGDGVTASLLETDGTVVGNADVTPVPPGTKPDPGPAAAPGAAKATPPGNRSSTSTPSSVAPPGPAGRPGEAASSQQISRTLSDGSLLTVAVDTASIDDVRSQLRSVLVPLLVGALVLAGLLLLVATRTALRPLDRMTTLAQGITRGQRGRRLAPERTDTELGRTAAAFDEMLDALEGAESRALVSESRTRQFVADAAHELRTPIAGVQAASEAMLTAGPSADDAERERLQLLVIGEARRASRLVDDLLSLASIDSGLELRLEPVDLGALLGAQADHLHLLAPGLTVELLAPPCTVLADQHQLTQVIANLLENARRYVPRPGRVLLSCACDAAAVQVLVADDGPGIPEADRERIFDRMVRLDDARTPAAGTTGAAVGSGLGLAIARGIARSHGGDLTCVSPTEPWTGAAFLLRLPGRSPAVLHGASASPPRSCREPRPSAGMPG